MPSRRPGPGLGLNQPGESLCDFCGQPNPTWYYPVREFHLEVPFNFSSSVFGQLLPPGTREQLDIVEEQTFQMDSGTRFYADDPCLDLIEAGDWPALERRYLSLSQLPLGLSTPQHVRDLWAEFRTHRAGPAVQVRTDDPAVQEDRHAALGDDDA
jgi:hypothetical protein